MRTAAAAAAPAAAANQNTEVVVDLDEDQRRHLAEFPRKTFALGLYHTMAISREGKLFAWGGNSNGQLGIGSVESKKKKKSTQQLRVELRKRAHARDGAGINKYSIEYPEERIRKMTHKEVVEALIKIAPQTFADEVVVDKPPKEDQQKPVLVRFPKDENLVEPTIIEVACGIKHTVALASNHRVYSWGSGANGKLGHGPPNEDRHVPTLIEGISRKRTIRITCGTDSTSCLMDSGQIYSFGVGRYGNLGHGTNVAQNVPVVIDALVGHKMIFVSMGSKHTLAIESASTSAVDALDPKAKRTNTVWAWGSGAFGRLGTPSDDGEFRPIQVPSLREENIVMVSAGETHSMAINDRGHVFTWGAGDYGKLGHGDTANIFTPKRVEQLAEYRITAVSTGSFHSIALTTQGRAFTWGGGPYGKLGHGDSNNQIVPKLVERLNNVVGISAGSFHTGFATAAGKLYLCGYGGNGRLGNGTSSNIPLQVDDFKDPIQVIASKMEIVSSQTGTAASDTVQSKSVKAIFLGGFHSIAVTDTGFAFSFGDGRCGQLGLNLDNLHKDDKREKLEPKFIPGISKVLTVACGTYHNIAVTTDFRLFSWGRGFGGVLGHGDATDQPEPRLVRALAHKRVKHCAASELHSICCTEDGELYTWGTSDFGKLGHGELNDETAPRLVQSMTKRVVQVACGFSHSLCLVEQTHDVYGWGSGHHGKLGMGDELNRAEPTVIDYLKRRNVYMIACGAFFSLALTRKGSVISWGSNSHGQLGRPVDAKNEPGIIEELRQFNVKQIACGEAHVLTLSQDGSVHSWGSNIYGQLGHGNRENKALPSPIDLLHDRKPIFIAAGANHSMVVTAYGELFVWGNGANGRLGLNSVEPQSQPTLCVAMTAALRETSTMGRHMLTDGQAPGGDKSYGKTKQRIDKMGGDGEEMETVDTGREASLRENQVLIRATAIATGAEPATLSNLQQLVKSETGEVRLELEEEQQKIAGLRTELDLIVTDNDKVETAMIEMRTKIKNVVHNQLQLQRKLASSEGYLVGDLKFIGQPDDAKLELPMEQYAKMLAILYESPMVLVDLAESIPTSNSIERARFWKVVLFTLFGDEKQERDEFQLLSLAHQLFLERGSKVSSPARLLDRDENSGILINEYLKRSSCQRAVRLTLSSVVTEVLKREKLLELNPLAIFKELHGEEVDQMPSLEEARDDTAVKDVYAEHVRIIQHQCKQFLLSITAAHSLIPFGVRWMAKRLDEIAETQLQSSDKRTERVTLVCRFLFSRMFNHGIVSPESVGITKKAPTQTMKKNLVMIMLILDRVISGVRFQDTPNEQHLTVFNNFIRSSKELLESYVESVTSVKSLDMHNRESRYIQTLSTLTPVISISINDMDFLHRLVDQGYRAHEIRGDRKEWTRILGQAGMVHGDVEEKRNFTINVRVRLSNRIIWPEQGQDPEMLQDKDTKTQLLMALQLLEALPLSVSGTLPENLEKAQQAATETEKYTAAKMIKNVLEFVSEHQTNNPVENKQFNDQFLRDTAAQVKKLARMRNILRQEYDTLKDMKDALRQHGNALKQQHERYRNYLKAVKQKKLTTKNMQVVKRKKKKPDYVRPEVRKKLEAIEKSLLVSSVMRDEHHKILESNADLKAFIMERQKVLRKMELADEVDLNPDWQLLFETNYKLMELIGRTPSTEAMVRQDPELQSLLDINPKFAAVLFGNSDLTPAQLQDFLLRNPDLNDFVTENDSLKQLLEARAKLYEKNKSVGNYALAEIDLGPMYTMSLDKARKEGIIVAMQFPDKTLSKMSLQFSSSLRGSIDILAFERKKHRAIAHFEITKELLIDSLGAERQFIEINRAKFDVEKLLGFVDTHLRW